MGNVKSKRASRITIRTPSRRPSHPNVNEIASAPPHHNRQTLSAEHHKLSRHSLTQSTAFASTGSRYTSTMRSNFKWLEGRRYADVQGIPYFLPNDMEELDRLTMEHYILRWAFDGNTIAPVQETLTKGACVLDIGCGPGTWLMEMAADYSNSEFVGVDICDLLREDAAIPPNCTFSIANILDGLPFEDSSFDFVHHRNMLFSYKIEHWPQVVGELYRVTKPGGWVQLVEMDMQIFRCSAQGESMNGRYRHALLARGCDPLICRRLDTALKAKGFTEASRSYLSIPLGEWGGRVGELLRDNYVAFIMAQREWLERSLDVSEDECRKWLNEICQEFETYRSYSNVYIGLGRKPYEGEKEGGDKDADAKPKESGLAAKGEEEVERKSVEKGGLEREGVDRGEVERKEEVTTAPLLVESMGEQQLNLPASTPEVDSRIGSEVLIGNGPGGPQRN
ncbi:uncharacterized protein VTP21DRAFT_3269 [Calcarisporiella thermophila]|uniref:uncharacterized protein n=1 Tax=Calcarisporiella thermophila TaxID=911321 RepID=UPI003743E9C7